MSSDFARPTADELAAATSISASTIHEAAGKIGALPAAIKPLDRGMRVCGPAFTVKGAPGDNLWLHHDSIRRNRVTYWSPIWAAITGPAIGVR